MKIISDIELEDGRAPKVVTIGFFDGVHAGHRFLIRTLQDIAREKAIPTAIVTFDEHPRKILCADYCPQLIMSKDEKIKELSGLGVDYCYFLHFTPELASLSAKEFIQKILKQKIGASVLLVGYDHRFGKDRKEGFDAYVQYGKEVGMEVLRLPPFSESGENPSSSFIRKKILSGEMDVVASILTHPYSLTGMVVDGFKIGRDMGFPTANLRLVEENKILPPDGVYAVKVLVSGISYGGMLYIGKRPTLNNGDDRSIEVNIFDFNEDIYNTQITIQFLKRTRGDIRFKDVASLRKQLEKDKKEVIRVLESFKG
ncbi:MAG: bifunctional riboflavin kinase/FAD synthetase [Bacteroidales bacterium]|nr:bifunctional riboflavin kinase/FAD synthetase [Bacteroidales bacterium]